MCTSPVRPSNSVAEPAVHRTRRVGVLLVIARRAILTTIALLCHLLHAGGLLTGQLHAQAAPESGHDSAVSQSGSLSRQKSGTEQPANGEPLIKADLWEMQGEVFTLRGNARIDYQDYRLQADLITYNKATKEATAEGHVVFDGGLHDEHLTASHGTYNSATDNGRFWEVVGTTGAKMQGKNVVLTSSSPFFFRGGLVEKVGRDKLIVHHGMVTSCTAPRPQWSFHAGRVTVVAGQDAKIYYSAFWFWRLPLFYFPFFDHPVERVSRKTGLLMPTIGTSSSKGTIFGEGVFWAINRSMDATLEAELLSKRGWSQFGSFNIRPSDSSYLSMHYFGVLDNKGAPVFGVLDNKGAPVTRQNQGGEEVALSAGMRLPENIRAVADIDYLSSYLYRQVFAESFRLATQSEVRSTGFLTRNADGYSLNAMASRYQNFQGLTGGDVISIRHSPSLEVDTVDRGVGDSPFYWGFSTSLDVLGRSEPVCCYDSHGNVIGAPVISRATAGRLDLFPRVSLPLSWNGWSLRPEVAVRETYYTGRLTADSTLGETAPLPISRRALETQAELHPPTVSRIFDRPFLGHTYRHYLEPRVVYRDVTGIDNFRSLLRFDERDVLSNTNEVEYGLVQRLYAKRAPRQGCNADGTPIAAESQGGTLRGKAIGPVKCEPVGAGAEVITWELAQKHFFDPSFGGALLPGTRNVLETTVEFAGIAFLTEPRHWSPVISRLKFHFPRIDAEWNIDYDTVAGHLSYSSENVSYRFTKDLSAGGGATFLHAPGEFLCSGSLTACGLSQSVSLGPSKYNQFNLNGRYGHINKKGFAAGGSLGFDANSPNNHLFLSSSAQTNYNWDCCGVVFEYRRFAVGNRNDHEYRFSFLLANIGSFGTLRKQERVY